jgi:hypothetical protein
MTYESSMILVKNPPWGLNLYAKVRDKIWVPQTLGIKGQHRWIQGWAHKGKHKMLS